MTPALSVAVMAHKRRERFVAELLLHLDRPAEVVWDSGRNDRWDTGRRAMLAYDPLATHHAVIQDDAIVCRDLLAGIEQALSHVPDGSPVSLYCGRTRPYRDLVQRIVDSAGPETSWLTMGQLHWGVGIVLPTRRIDDMLGWCDQRSDIDNYDKRISRWCQHMGLAVYYPWPSLVDHRESPSLVQGRGHAGRRAHRFIGADASALDRDWTGEAVSIPALGVMDVAQLAKGRWRVTGHAAHASVATATGRASQLHFRGAVLSGVPVPELQHLLSVGLIEPVPETTTPPMEAA